MSDAYRQSGATSTFGGVKGGECCRLGRQEQIIMKLTIQLHDGFNAVYLDTGEPIHVNPIAPVFLLDDPMKELHKSLDRLRTTLNRFEDKQRGGRSE